MPLSKQVEESIQNFQKKSMSVIQQLFSLDFLFYSDLQQRAKALLSEALPAHLQSVGELKEIDSAERIQKVQDFLDSQFQKIASLLQQGKIREQKLNEIKEFQGKLTHALAQFKWCLDEKPRLMAVVEDLNKLSLKKAEFAKLDTSQIESAIDQTYAQFVAMQAASRELFDEISQECKNHERSTLESIRTVKRKLFEIFTVVTPYPNLKAELRTLANSLLKKMNVWSSNFFQGVRTAQEVREHCVDLPYEHDVILLRNELDFRATRLLELREENHRILRQILDTRNLMEVVGFPLQDRLYGEVVTLIGDLQKFLVYLENPFQVFATSTEFENVNETFRKCWIQMEAFRPKVHACQKAADAYFQMHFDKIKKQFLKTVDSLEEVCKATNGVRPNLVLPLERELNETLPVTLLTVFQSQVIELERRFGFAKPFSFFMSISDFRLQQKLLLEAKRLFDHIESTILFAKSLQYIKTFEEERVDTILEAFERRYLIEDGKMSSYTAAWEKYFRRMENSITLIEREVILDIGLLDMRSLLDVEEEQLQNTLHRTVVKAKTLVPALQEELRTQVTEGVLSQTVRDTLIRDLSAWREGGNVAHLKKEGSLQEARVLLKKLAMFCHFLFEAKIQIGAVRSVPSALFAQLSSELKVYLDFVENYLQEKREKKGTSLFGKPWIAESFALRAEGSHLELCEEQVEDFQSVVESVLKRVEQIPEIKEQDNKEKAERVKLESELRGHLEKLATLDKSTSIAKPLHYIPGFLDYFAP